MAAGPIGLGNVSRLIQEGVGTVFGDELKEFPTIYDKMFRTLSSTKAFEVNVQLEGFNRASLRPEGDNLQFDSRRQGFTPKYVMRTFAKGFIVTKQALSDELYGQLSEGATKLARCMRITKELEGASVYNNGFDPAFTMIDGDGSPLFDTAHSNGPSGGTYSNRLAIDADLSEAALEDLLALVQTTKDARGLPAMLQAVRLVIAAGNNTFNAQRILGSVLQNDTSNNATNAIRDMNQVRDGLLSSPYLTDPKAWFLTTDILEGLKYYTRWPVEFGQDNAFASSNARFKADERYDFGWDQGRGVFGSQGS